MNDNDSMRENREKPRYRALAHAQIHGLPESEGLVKNISVTGCCIEYADAEDILPDTRYQLDILPEKASKIGKFELLVERKWVHHNEDSTDVGFIIAASPTGKHFQRYVDFLAAAHS